MDITRRDAWVTAARPRTLPAAVSPVLVGGGLAAGADTFRPDAFLAALIGALAIQIAANFANDASDAARGADTADRVGPPRMVASGAIDSRRMWAATALAVVIATAAGAWLITIAGWVIAVIGVASIAAMLTYVGGPLPYGYRGWGEVSVFVFFGLVATVGSRYVHDGAAPADAWWLGSVMGALAAAILVANNLRDLDTDQLTGKRTLAVILGAGRTRSLYRTLVIGAFALVAIGPMTVTAPGTALGLVALPLAVPTLRILGDAPTARSLVPLLGATARLQLVTGALLAAGAAFS